MHVVISIKMKRDAYFCILGDFDITVQKLY